MGDFGPEKDRPYINEPLEDPFKVAPEEPAVAPDPVPAPEPAPVEACANPFCDGQGNLDVSVKANGRAWLYDACEVGPHPE